MNKGEIWWINLPQIIGREQIGKRPAIILGDTKTSLIIIIPLTSSKKALKYPYTIKINPSKQNNLDIESIALLFQLRAIDKRRMLHKLGELEKNYLEEIDKNLKNLFRLD